jgi:predicted ATP-dependent endonuclease of OLD family
MIASIEIENFRSIKNLYLEPTNLTSLIGANSSGKSNILKAIDLVLGEGWTTKAKVARELFYDTSKDIKITIGLSKNIPYNDKYKNRVVQIEKVQLTMSLKPQLSCDTKLISDEGNLHYLNEEFKKQCHFIYIPANRDLKDEMRVSTWTLLGKLMKLVQENYIETFVGGEDKLKDKFTEIMQPPKDFLEEDFHLDKVTFKKFKDTFQKYCEFNSAGLANSFNPTLDIYNINWFYKTLQIIIKEDFIDKTFDAEEVGSGMQNLILLSIFQTYAELMGGKAILAIEEPEIYLYPQAQRELYKSMQSLSENTQIFYTTHNPNFVDAVRAYEVQMVQKSKEKGTIVLDKDNKFLTKNNAEKLKYKIYTHFNSERNELFFANKVLLVEGPSDKALWTILSQDKWDINLDRECISIIECGGKSGVIYFAGVCQLLGITDFFAIWDKDNKEDTIEDKHNILSGLLSNARGLEQDPDIESVLEETIPLGNDSDFIVSRKEKIRTAFEWAEKVQETEIPSTFEIVKQFLEKKSDKDVTELPKSTEKVEINEVLESDLPF